MNESMNDVKEYDVKDVVDHKDDKSGRRWYLVRWKGFDACDDTWVKANDLHCPKILKKYKRTLG